MNKLKYEIESYLINNSNKIKINSETIKQGDVFFALKGSNTHGNNYIKHALSNGAKYAVTDKRFDKNFSTKILKVTNSLNFLDRIARKKRNQFKGIVIAVTGSVGKTSIKEFLKFFLLSQGDVSASIKSYNNYLGVLISLINMDRNSIFSIFEVGTNNSNEIKKLASLILPHQVIISNICPTHLHNFGSTRKIAIEKSDLFNPKYNQNINLAILPNLNQDEIFLQKLAKKYSIRSIIKFGSYNKSEYFIKTIKKFNNFSSKITYKIPSGKITFKSSTSFKHQILNMLIVFIVFDFNNLSIKKFLKKAKSIPFIKGRGLFNNIIINKKKVVLIDESYNASPASMNVCIDYFENLKIKQDQRKFIIIGEMLELGRSSQNYHRKIFSRVVKSSIDKIIFCGNIYKKILNKRNVKSKKIFYFDEESKIIDFLNNNILKNDIILAKGSNSSRVNKLVNLLLKIKRKNLKRKEIC